VLHLYIYLVAAIFSSSLINPLHIYTSVSLLNKFIKANFVPGFYKALVLGLSVSLLVRLNSVAFSILVVLIIIIKVINIVVFICFVYLVLVFLTPY
jgi:hypothetical protein